MPETLGKYDLLQILGKGAMGVVYEGFDPIIGRRLAIKTVRIPDAEDVEAQDELARFKREAQAAGRLSHPNIVSVFDYGETPDMAYIVMEFVDGTTLKHVLDRNERFELSEIIRLMHGLLAGLHYSHGHGVVHRDIKPANIMLAESGEIKIADFGIARIESSSLTQAGTVMGTPSYMSPEQFIGQIVDSRTDIYSAGVLLYQLLTGEKPFAGGLTAVMHKVLNVEPPPPSALSVTVPQALDGVVRKAMAKRPSERFASAAEFDSALQAAFENRAYIKIGSQASLLADENATQVISARSIAAAKIESARTLPVAYAPQPGPVAVPPVAIALRKPVWLWGLGALIVAGAIAFLICCVRMFPAMLPVTLRMALSGEAPSRMAAQRNSILQSNLGTLPCSLITATSASDNSYITGLIGTGAPQAAFTTAINALPANIKPQSVVQTIDARFCSILDVVRPYNAFRDLPGTQLVLRLAGGSAVLHAGQLITVKEKMPAYSGYLQTDYFLNNGDVFHLYPTHSDPLRAQPGGSTRTIGDPTKGGGSWPVGAPFGTNLILSTVTASPLFPALRPQNETASDYLPALRQALQTATSAGRSSEVAAVPVVTAP